MASVGSCYLLCAARVSVWSRSECVCWYCDR